MACDAMILRDIDDIDLSHYCLALESDPIMFLLLLTRSIAILHSARTLCIRSIIEAVCLFGCRIEIAASHRVMLEIFMRLSRESLH